MQSLSKSHPNPSASIFGYTQHETNILVIWLLGKIIEKFRDRRGSPLVEEGLLIGLAIVIFVVIVAIVSQIIDWINQLAGELPTS